MGEGPAGLLQLIGLGVKVEAAQTAKRGAKRLEKVQIKQAKLQQRLTEARARRQARIRSAQLRTTAGAAGITGSIVEAPLTGIETQVETQQELTAQQTTAQIQQFGIARSQTAQQANAAIAGALGTFAAEAIETDVFGFGSEEEST